MILSVMKGNDLRVEDMLKRSFAEYEGQVRCLSLSVSLFLTIFSIAVSLSIPLSLPFFLIPMYLSPGVLPSLIYSISPCLSNLNPGGV